MSPPGFAAIILAAGEGTRLNSARPKVLHEIAGQPMIRHVIAALRPLEPAETVVVIGRDMDAVARAVAPRRPRSNTRRAAPATRCASARPLLADRSRATARSTISRAVRRHAAVRTETIAACSKRGAVRPKPPSRSPACGRPIPEPMAALVLDRDGGLRASSRRGREPGGAGDRAVQWRHHGDRRAARLRPGGPNRQRQRQARILPDRHRRDRESAQGLVVPRRSNCRPRRCSGSTPAPSWPPAEALMQDRLRRRAMEDGATLVAPETVFLCADTRLGRDVVIEPNVVFGPGVSGRGQRADPLVLAYRGRRDRAGRDRRPVRPAAPRRGARSRRACRQFRRGQGHPARRRRQGQPPVAISATAISAPAPISAPARSPAITTALTNGARRSASGAFIGSNTALVAPVSVGDGAYVATGSVITSDVPADALTIARARQVDKPGRAAELRDRLRAERERASKENG